MSANGQWVLSIASNERSATVWDLKHAKADGEFKSDKPMKSVAFLPHSTEVFLGQQGVITRWNWRTNSTSVFFKADFPSIEIGTLAISRDGGSLAWGGIAQPVRFCQIASCKLVTLAQSADTFSDFEISSDGRWLRTIGNGISSGIMWDLVSGSPNSNFINLSVVTLRPDGLALLAIRDWTGQSKTRFVYWDCNTQREKASLPIEVPPDILGWSFRFSPDSRWLAAISSSGSLRIWDANTAELVLEKKLQAGTPNPAVVFSPDSRLVAACASSYEIYSTRDWKHLRSFPMQAFTPNLSFSPDGNVAVYTNQAIPISTEFHDVSSGELLGQVPFDFGVGATFDPKGQRILISGKGKLRIWNIVEKREEPALEIGDSRLVAIHFLNDTNIVVIGTADGLLEAWDFEKRRLLISWASFQYSADSGWGENWINVMPSGLFDGSPGGWKRLSLRFHHDTFNSALIDRYFADFYQPGIFQQALSGHPPNPETEISAIDRNVAKLQLSVTPEATAILTSPTVSLAIDVDFSANDKNIQARDVQLMRNGTLVQTWPGQINASSDGHAILHTNIRVLAGPNVFTAYCFNAANVKTEDASLILTGAKELSRTRRLFILAIGINRYSNPNFKLIYARDDARAVANAVRTHREALPFPYMPIQIPFITPQGTQLKPLEQWQRVVVLEDAEATRENILLGLSRLVNGNSLPTAPGCPQKIGRL